MEAVANWADADEAAIMASILEATSEVELTRQRKHKGKGRRTTVMPNFGGVRSCPASPRVRSCPVARSAQHHPSSPGHSRYSPRHASLPRARAVPP